MINTEIKPFILASRLKIYLISMVIAINGLLFGLETGVISGAILFINNQFQLTPPMQSMLMAAILFGACFGALFGGRLADLWGRRKLLFADAIIFVAGIFITTLATSYWFLVSGRFITGLAVGISSFVAPLYVSEISTFKNRGTLVGFFQLFICIGILISYIADYFFAFGSHWRWMMAIGFIPALVFFVSLFFLPESPRWLMENGKDNRAREVLNKVRAFNSVEAELTTIKEVAGQTRESFSMLLRPWLMPAVIISFGVGILQQLVGINTIIYFAPFLFEFGGYEQVTSSILATIGAGIVLVLFTMLGQFLLDRWGRRPLLLLGLTGTTISLIAIAFSFGVELNCLIGKQILTLASVMCYLASFALSLGPIGWLISSEVFPLRIRGLATSFTAAIIWGFNMLVTGSFLYLLEHLLPIGTFLLYSVISLLGLIFVYYFVPETKGVSLEHIEYNLRQGKRCRDLGS